MSETTNKSAPATSPVANGSAFVEYEGCVHLISPAQAGEFTLCGDAFDAHSTEDAPEREFKPTRKRTVTCEVCASIILACRGVRVHPPNTKLRNAGPETQPETKAETGVS